jgi:hypothetical protein
MLDKIENYKVRKSIRVVGTEILIDKPIVLRVRRGEKVAIFNAIFGLSCYMVNSFAFSGLNEHLNIAAIVFGAFLCMGMCMVYYKNVSWPVIKILLREVNVVIVFIAGMCICIIDCLVPRTPFAPIHGFIYWMFCALLVGLDAINLKSRAFVLAFGTLMTLLNLTILYDYSLGTWDNDVVLVGPYLDGLILYKRSVKRSLFLQVFTFSLSGLYVLFKDKEQNLMIFATGNIYRESGNASLKNACTCSGKSAGCGDATKSFSIGI